MRKHASLLVSIFAVSGIIGAVLRYIHIATCYDAAGLPVSGKPVTFILLLISIAAAAAAFIIAAAAGVRYAPEPGYSGAFSSKRGGFGLLSQLLSAALIAASAVMYFMRRTSSGRVSAILGILSAATVVFVAVCSYKRKQTGSVAYLSIIPSLYFFLRLITVFSANISNPVLLTYSFDCVALGAASLYVFASGGYALNKVQTFSTVFTGLIAAAFSFIALTGQQTTAADVLIYLSIPALIVPSLTIFLKNLSAKK